MEDLLRFLQHNWWLLFILLPWIGSVVGDVFTKAAKKAAAEERARRRQAGSQEPGAQLPQAERRPSAEEVAAEIRRMMGMEVQEERRSPSRPQPVILEEEWQEEEWQEEEWEEPEPRPEPKLEPVRSLRDRLAETEARRIQQTTARAGVHEHHLQTALMHKLQVREGSRYGRRRAARALPGAHGMRVGELVNLTDPAKAFVLLEVLGPPKALRDETF